MAGPLLAVISELPDVFSVTPIYEVFQRKFKSGSSS